MRGKKRLQAAASRIGQLPVQLRAIDSAYAHFLDAGILPNNDTLAGAVLNRVLHARKPEPEHQAEIRALGLHQPYGTTREMLFREAMCSFEPVRNFARFLLRAAVEAGHDPTDPWLIGPELEESDFSPVCLRLMGWPDDFVRPEHRDQLQRVLTQQATEAETKPKNDDEWDRRAGAALAAFLNHGTIPDSRYLLFVLTTCEGFALHAHYVGRCGDELLAAYEAVATAKGKQREAALRHLSALQAKAEFGR